MAQFAGQTRDRFWQFTVDGMTFGWSIDGAARADGRAEGAKASYDGVFPGVDAMYEVLATGVKETLVLADRNVPTHYRFLLEPPSDVELEAVELPDGSWGLYRPQDVEPFVVLERPYAVDAPDGREVSPASRRNASMSVRRQGDVFAVAVTLDRGWLTADDRRFPVHLDPTITVPEPTEEKVWKMTCGTCGAYGTGFPDIGTSDDEVLRTTMQFDLSAVPEGAVVTNAELRARHVQ